MKTLVVVLLALMGISGFQAEPARGQNHQVVHIGVSDRTFPAANRNDALAALKVWASMVFDSLNIQEEVEISMYDSIDELRAAYERGGIDVATLTTEETMLLGMEPDYVYLPSQSHGFHVRYVLLVHRESGIQELTDLAKSKVVFFNNQYMVLAHPWLETLVAAVPEQRVDFRGMVLKELDTPSKAILQVFFQQAQGALVTLETFELACELNPQLRNALDILHESPPLVPKMLVFRPDWKGATRDRLEEAVLDLHATPGGQQVLTVFQSSRLNRQPGSVLDPTRRFIEEYRRMASDAVLRPALP